MSNTKVVYEPLKQVVIHQVSKYDSPEQLVRTAFTGAPVGTIFVLRWVDGVLLTFSALPYTETTVRELIAGTLHWSNVSFAPMPTFQPQIVANGITCRVSDVSHSPVFRAIAQFLKAI